MRFLLTPGLIQLWSVQCCSFIGYLADTEPSIRLLGSDCRLEGSFGFVNSLQKL